MEAGENLMKSMLIPDGCTEFVELYEAIISHYRVFGDFTLFTYQFLDITQEFLKCLGVQ